MLNMQQIPDDFVVTVIFWANAVPVWIHCRKRPNYDFCTLHGSVDTVIRWGGL